MVTLVNRSATAAKVQPVTRRPSGDVAGRTFADVVYASAKLRVTAGSTGMPGPVVVDTTIFFR